MREAGATAEETVMVGDSAVDILTARNAGLWSVGVTYGFAPQTLEQAPPDVLVDTPADLAQALTQSAVTRKKSCRRNEVFIATLGRLLGQFRRSVEQSL